MGGGSWGSCYWSLYPCWSFCGLGGGGSLGQKFKKLDKDIGVGSRSQDDTFCWCTLFGRCPWIRLFITKNNSLPLKNFGLL